MSRTINARSLIHDKLKMINSDADDPERNETVSSHSIN